MSQNDNSPSVFGIVPEVCIGRVLTSEQFDSACLKEIISNCLNLGVIGGAALVYIPQLVKIIRAKNVAGLSEATYLIQIFSNSLSIAYSVLRGIPFRNWGELALINAQFYAIVILFWFYLSNTPGDKASPRSGFMRLNCRRAALVVFYMTFIVVTFSGLIPPFVLPLFGLSPLPLIVLGRLPQIYLNYKQKHTGQLSAATTLSLVLGNSARVYTTFSQVNDRVLLTAHMTALVFNIIPLLQMLLYWNKTNRLIAAGSSKKKDE